MSEKIALTIITLLILGPIWFFTGYWAIEKNKSRWAFAIYLCVCGTIGFCLGTIFPAIWVNGS